MTLDMMAKVQRDLASGRFASAQKKVRALVRAAPRNADVQNLAGVCFAAADQHRQAIPYFSAALRAAPQNGDIQANLVSSLIMSGEHGKAEAIIARLLDTSARPAMLHYLQAYGRLHVGDAKGAVQAATQALAIEPNHIQALGIRADASSSLSLTHAALADFQTILEIDPDQSGALKNCIDRLNELGRRKEALALCDDLLRREPGNAFALARAVVLDDAEALPHRAIAVGTAIENASKDDDEEQALLALAQAEVSKRQGDRAQAMRHYDRMHALDAARRAYKPAASWAEFRQIRALFPADRKSLTRSDAPVRPIFIVGLPRSGTTLVEMILSTHPEVAAFGELEATERHFRAVFGSRKTCSDTQLEAFASRYLDDLPAIPAGKTAFVDKMPGNFRFVGLLAAAFPNARIINVQRDPRDVAVSMWMTRFNSVGMAFASRIEGIADQANLYRSYIRHWREVFPDRMLSLDYEALVRDHEAQGRRIANYCGLDWSDAMLHPEASTAAVRTASVNQVREKVHARSIGNWHLLGEKLDPFLAALDKRLWSDIL